MTRQPGPYYDENYLRQGSPNNSTFVESVPRPFGATDLDPLTGGVAFHVGVPLQFGDVITNIAFVSGATAADTPTHWGFALYSPAGVLLATSLDKTTTAWAANTVKTLPMVTPYLVSTPGLYYASMWQTGTDLVSLWGVSLGNAVVSGAGGASAGVLAQTSGSSLTTAAPATISSPTTNSAVPYVVVS